MSWLGNKVKHWAIGNQQGELSAFVSNLQAMDGQEIGALVALGTDFKNRLKASGHVVTNPIVYYGENPKFPITLSGSISDLQKAGKTQEAAALMVWLHTMRAGATLELRQLGRDMWREIARGFPHAHDAAIFVGSALGRSLDLRGYDEFPNGLTPDPLS